MRFKSLVLILLCSLASPLLWGADRVEIRPVSGENRVEVRIDGKHFTSYHYDTQLRRQKPFFYPVLSPAGVKVNRDYPMKEGVSGESDDHPHHQSVFFGYGSTNGADFWSNMNDEKIVHRAILNHSSGEEGVLQLLADWVTAEDEIVAQETKRVRFGGGKGAFWMDHDIEVQALDSTVTFEDTKEGFFAIRLNDQLREDKGTGRYVNAFGVETSEKIWGKRSPWVAIRGEVDGQPVTVAIFDHPTTVHHPSYWHARGYGLFAVNPFGRKDYMEGYPELDYRLAPYESFHFRYRIVVYDGKVEQERLINDYLAYMEQ